MFIFRSLFDATNLNKMQLSEMKVVSLRIQVAMNSSPRKVQTLLFNSRAYLGEKKDFFVRFITDT